MLSPCCWYSVEKREGPLDLMITDVVMPLMSGPELASRVKSRSPNTRVLYISVYSPDTFGQESLIGKEAHTLAKPFTPAQLLEKVRKALDTR